MLPENASHRIPTAFRTAPIQFLTRSDSKELLCEAVSAKSNPELANMLTSDRETVLYGFGFEPVGVSRNYSQRIDIESDEDLGYAARLAFRILKQIYQVKSFGSGTFKLHIPNVASN